MIRRKKEREQDKASMIKREEVMTKGSFERKTIKCD